MKALSREGGRKRCHASGCGVSGGAKYEIWSASHAAYLNRVQPRFGS